MESIRLLSSLSLTLTPVSGFFALSTPLGIRRTFQIVQTDSSSKDLNSSIELITWTSYKAVESVSFQPRLFSIVLHDARSPIVVYGDHM